MLRPNKAVNTGFIRVLSFGAARRFGIGPAAQYEAVDLDRETVAIRRHPSRPTQPWRVLNSCNVGSVTRFLLRTEPAPKSNHDNALNRLGWGLATLPFRLTFCNEGRCCPHESLS